MEFQFDNDLPLLNPKWTVYPYFYAAGAHVDEAIRIYVLPDDTKVDVLVMVYSKRAETETKILKLVSLKEAQKTSDSEGVKKYDPNFRNFYLKGKVIDVCALLEWNSGEMIKQLDCHIVDVGHRVSDCQLRLNGKVLATLDGDVTKEQKKLIYTKKKQVYY